MLFNSAVTPILLLLLHSCPTMQMSALKRKPNSPVDFNKRLLNFVLGSRLSELTKQHKHNDSLEVMLEWNLFKC